MPRERVVSSLYGRNLSQPLLELLTDPLSDAARARQTALLIAASLVLLLSTGIAQVNEYKAGEAKLTLISPLYANRIAFAVTAYLLVIYLLAVFADWSVVSLKHWAAKAAIKDIEATMVSDQKDRIDRDQVRIKRLHELGSQVDEILAEQKATVDPIMAQTAELANATPDKPATPEFFALTDKINQANNAFEARLDPLLKEIRVWHNQLTLDPWIAMQADQAAIERTRSQFSFLTRLRVLLEVLFPATYATVALVLALLHW